MKNLFFIGSLVLGKYSLNLSVKLARRSINHQSDLSNLNQRLNQPVASIWPVGLIVTLLVTLLHSTAIFAMDSKVIAKATKEIVGGIERLSEDEQKGIFGSELDEVVEEGRDSFQQAFPPSSSRNGGSSFTTLLEPSATVTNFASSSSSSIDESFSNSWNAILNAQKDSLEDVLESKGLNLHKNYLKDARGINSNSSLDHSDDSDHKTTEISTIREQMAVSAKKFVNWKEKTLVTNTAQNTAQSIFNKKKEDLEPLLFKEADKAWRMHEDVVMCNAVLSRERSIRKVEYNPRLLEAYHQAQVAEHNAREEYLNSIITEARNAEAAGTNASCMESALSEMFWKSKNQKRVKFAQSDANNKDTRKEALEKIDNTVFETVWPEAVQEEIEREARINQTRTQVFEHADQAWITYIKIFQEDNKENKEKAVTDAQALELAACETYKNAVMTEALEAAKSVHSRAAEGAWAVRVETAAKAVAKAVKDKTKSENSVLKAMILSVAPWASSNTLKFLCDNSEIKNGLIEAAELAMTNVTHEDHWRKKVAEEIPYSLEVSWKKENDNFAFFAQTEDGKKNELARKTAEVTYWNVTKTLERAVSIAEAYLSASKNAWPKEYEGSEEAREKIIK